MPVTLTMTARAQRVLGRCFTCLQGRQLRSDSAHEHQARAGRVAGASWTSGPPLRHQGQRGGVQRTWRGARAAAHTARMSKQSACLKRWETRCGTQGALRVTDACELSPESLHDTAIWLCVSRADVCTRQALGVAAMVAAGWPACLGPVCSALQCLGTVRKSGWKETARPGAADLSGRGL